MKLIITDAWLAKSQALPLTGFQLNTAFLLSALLVMLLALGLYHWFFLKGAQPGWPIIGSVLKLVAKDEFDQRDRFLRENLDVMARRLGEMRVKLTPQDPQKFLLDGLDATGEQIAKAGWLPLVPSKVGSKSAVY